MNGLDKKDIVKEVRALMDQVDAARNEIDVYCGLMRQVFLSCSNEN